LKYLSLPKKCNDNRQAEDLVRLFNERFANTENTMLIGGAEEPIYKPANDDCQYNQVVFTRDYFSSALHEIAHWCIAGIERRNQIDYAYWYLPDGRDPHQQVKFEAAEVKPQALEYAFSLASDITFRVSIDNLQGEQTSSKSFERAVDKQLATFIKSGFSVRAQQFLNTLHQFYGTPDLTPLSTINESFNHSKVEFTNNKAEQSNQQICKQSNTDHGVQG